MCLVFLSSGRGKFETSRKPAQVHLCSWFEFLEGVLEFDWTVDFSKEYESIKVIPPKWFHILLIPVLSAALYFGSWFFCKSNDLIPANPNVDHPSNPETQTRLSPPQTPVPGFEFRQQRQTASQHTDPEGEALAQAGPDSRSSSPVPGIARYTTDDESVTLSFKTSGDESRNSFLPIGQIESSI